MAATWKGSISFGLVNIPIELHGAVADSGPHFRLLHAKDESPVSYERVCQKEDKTVSWQEIVKGYEYAKGKYAILSKEDFQKAALEKTKTIDVLDFVKDEDIDDRYFDTPYYIIASKAGARGYAVLREALRESGRVGIGKMVMREKQHLVALSVVEDALVLTTMRFADELVDVGRFSFPSRKELRPKELQMAKQLVESLADDWQPEKYSDEHKANLMRIIKAKAKGKEPKLIAEEAERSGHVVDLMERLRQSLEGRAGGGKTKAGGRGKPARRKRSTRRAAA